MTERINKLLNSKISPIGGLLSFLFLSLSYLIGHDAENANHMLILIKAGLIAASAIFYLITVNSDSSEQVRASYSVLSSLILFHELILIMAAGSTIITIRDYPAILNSIVWIPCGLIGIIRFRTALTSFFKRLINNRDTMILIISSTVTAAVVIILSLEPNGVRFTWDSNELYRFIYSRDYEALYDANLLTFHNHVSVVYDYLLIMLKLLFNDIRIAFFIVNTLCIVCASFGMTFLLRSLLPERKNIDYMLGNLIFMLSPWVCGMSTYYKYDYFIWCLFPLLVYFLSKNNLIGIFISGILITFSKSSGLIIFGALCVGILIADVYSDIKNNKGRKLKEIIRALLCNINYWYYLSIGAIFIIFFLLAIPKETQFEDAAMWINPPHIFQQLKLYSSANFLWIFVILTFACIVYVFRINRSAVPEKTGKILTIMIIADILFIIFVCLCNTYRVPRYMDSHITTVYILAAVLLLILPKRRFKYIMMSILCVIGLISSFYMIDPVSKTVFNTFSVGDRTIVDYEMGDNPSPGDSIICNREYYSYEIVLDKALTYVINNKGDNDEIMFSLGKQPVTWGLSGGRYSYTYNDGKHYFEEFYDKTINGLANGYDYEYSDSDEMIPLEIHYIFDRETIEDAVSESRSDTFWYIYMPTLNFDKEDELYCNYNVLSEEVFEFRGWKMNCIKFKYQNVLYNQPLNSP